MRHVPSIALILLGALACAGGAEPAPAVLAAATTAPLPAFAVAPDVTGDTAFELSLRGSWRFRVEKPAVDSAEWSLPTFDDRGWDLRDSGAPWTGIPADAVGWYRQRLVVPAGWAGRPLVLSLGKPDGAVEVWLDGRKAASRPTDLALVLPLAADALAPGEHLVAVRTVGRSARGRLADAGKPAVSGGLQGKDFTIEAVHEVTAAPVAVSGSGGKQRLDLGGAWRFLANDGVEPPAGWQGADFADGGWLAMPDALAWNTGGFDLEGSACYRRAVTIPAAWRGTTVLLRLGKLDCGDEVWLNGVRVGGLVGKYAFKNRQDRVYALPPAAVRWGASNLLAVRITDHDKLGGFPQPGKLSDAGVTLETDPTHLLMRWSGEKGDKEVAAESFDVSTCQAGRALEIIRPVAGARAEDKATAIDWQLVDLYGNEFAKGAATWDDALRCVVALDAAQSRLLYQRGGFDLRLTPQSGGRKSLGGTVRVPWLSYDARDRLALPALSETWEETPYGRLRLVDDIDCATPPERDLHPYIESGLDKRAQHNAPGAPAKVAVEEIMGRRCRTVSEGWFAYRLGRGTLPAHRAYVVRMDYPEDMPRYASVELSLGWNFQDLGWRNGVGPGDPYDDYPLSKAWQSFDAMAVTDAMTYGSGGAEAAPVGNGFWVFVLDKGRKGTPQYQGGPAVARIRLYEIDPQQNAPAVAAPRGSQRTLMMDWERGPQCPPEDIIAYCRLMGCNAVAPTILKWASAAYWPAGAAWDRLRRQERQIWPRYLAAGAAGGVGLIPRLEYGGSLALPEAARSLAPDGAYAKPNRFAEWGADILHPATWDDLAALVDDVLVANRDNPQLRGMLWRMRCERIQPGFTRADIAQYATARKVALPALADRDLALWAASGAAAADYALWWQERLRDLHLRLRDKLQAARPDWTLWYHHWDSDKWSLGPYDWFSARNFGEIAKKGGAAVYAEHLARRAALTGDDYVRMVREGVLGYSTAPSTHLALRADLYRDAQGIALFAPAEYRYLSDCPEYLAWFRTGAGVALSNQITYDEHGWRSINPRHETNMVVPAGPAFSMANEVLACFHADPRTISTTGYTYGRGFADAHRRFARAYRALPAVEGAVLDGGPALPADMVRVRAYPADSGEQRLGVVHRGMTALAGTFALAAPDAAGWPAGAKVVDLVGGAEVPSTLRDGRLCFSLDLGPMELRALAVRR